MVVAEMRNRVFNVDKNKEDAVAFVRMIQGMSFEEVKDLLKEKSGIMYGCTVSYYIFKAEAGADNSLKFYMMWSLEGAKKAVLTENIGLLQVRMYVTAYPTREELLDSVKYGNVTVNEKFSENEEKILVAFARKLKKIDINNIEPYLGNFKNVDYKWEIDTSSHVRYDCNGEQKNANSIF